VVEKMKRRKMKIAGNIIFMGIYPPQNMDKKRV
jgi:hypothetical protein